MKADQANILIDLKNACKPIDGSDVYFRPFISKGNPQDSKIFLVGVNPATPIKTKEIDLESYTNLLMDYQLFHERYLDLRGTAGVSRTRMGILEFVRWISSYTNTPVLETNVITYPTKSIKELKRFNKENPKGYNKATNIFVSLLKEIEPSIIILHGANTVRQFNLSVGESGMLLESMPSKPIRYLENKGVTVNISYPSGKEGKVFACRHLMYHGKVGKSYKEFKDRLKEILEKGAVC